LEKAGPTDQIPAPGTLISAKADPTYQIPAPGTVIPHKWPQTNQIPAPGTAIPHKWPQTNQIPAPGTLISAKIGKASRIQGLSQGLLRLLESPFCLQFFEQLSAECHVERELVDFFKKLPSESRILCSLQRHLSFLSSSLTDF
jgi:hypothetical protein